jgi:nicotinate-nucleotide adenylyltransferase
MRKRIGIFGGSFNPPHRGHIEMCRHLLENNDVDEIWVMPCFKHPFAKEMAPFEDRMTMCKFAFGEFHKKVKIVDIERKLGSVSYTLETVEYLQHHFPREKFFLIMGSDTVEEFSKWKDYQKIKLIIQTIQIKRGAGSNIPDISATEIRESIKKGRKFTELVSREVAVYIITHGLYSTI